MNLDLITFARVNRYMMRFENDAAVAAGYGGAGAQCSLSDVLGDDGSVPDWYLPLWETAYACLPLDENLTPYARADRAARAVARAALALIYPAL